MLLAACAAVPQGTPADASFALIGDMPVLSSDVPLFDAMIDEMNAEDLSFIAHVGDIKSGGSACSDELFAARKRQFERSRHPFILLPGDNDWTDCHRSGGDPLEALTRFRRVFYPDDGSLGERAIRIERQSDHPRYRDYREHMRWTFANVMFVALNVQGSNNNLGRTAEMNKEFARRMAAVLAWLEDSVAVAEEKNLAP